MHSIEILRNKLAGAVDAITQSASNWVRNPDSDFVRNRKLPFRRMLELLLSMGSGTLNKELLESYGFSHETPTASAFVQQRQKILPSALEALFRHFTDSLTLSNTFRGYRLFACDGTKLLVPELPNSNEDRVISTPGAKPFSMQHLNVLYDLCNEVYVDAELQQLHEHNEHQALITMVNRSCKLGKVIIVADRGYESYNTLARLTEAKLNYIIRVRDSGIVRRIVADFNAQSADEFDIQVSRTLSRSEAKAVSCMPDYYCLKDKVFDLLPFGSSDVYRLSFRVVRFNIGGSYETVITNITDFMPETLKEVYGLRWGVESSFRELKYSIGLNCFHAKNRDSIAQEVFARLTMYNFISQIIDSVSICQERKYKYHINFSLAVTICRSYLREITYLSVTHLESLLRMFTEPIRPNRSFKRRLRSHFSIGFPYRTT